MQKIEGKITRVFVHNEKNYYTVMSFRDRNTGKNVSVVGYFPMLLPYLNMTLFGEWKKHPKYGEQFSVLSYAISEPQTEQELTAFLTGEIGRCSYGVASNVARELGLSYLEHYEDIPTILHKLSDQTKARQELVGELTHTAQRIKRFFERREMIQFLTNWGFDHVTSSKIAFSEYPPTIQAITTNPYALVKQYDLEWKKVDQIALANGFNKMDTLRIEEAIVYLSEEASNSESHMYLPQDELEKRIKSFLGFSIDMEAFLASTEEEGKIVRDLKNRIYSKLNFHLEKSLASNLYRIAQSAPCIKTKQIKIDATNYPYSPDQVEAIELALNNQLSIISGPAGTGKTTIVNKMIEEFKKLGYNIQLCAPTGRAAKRMAEVTKMKAKTVHHLLAFHAETKEPLYTRTNPLPATCYIVDETSMLDTKIASYLLAAVPSGSKVVIIGDEDQLPSIGPGTVLKDLLDCGFFATKRLTDVFRQKGGSHLLDTSMAIRKGESIDFPSFPEKCDFKLFNLTKPEHIRLALEKLVTNFVKTGQYDVFNDLQIISPIHNGPLGVVQLNALVQKIVNPNTKNELTFGSRTFREGDKVIQLTNDYDKKIYNGDIGRIITIEPKTKSILVDFQGKTFEYIGGDLFDIDLAYVLTVHKVQGGEYNYVLMPFHPSFGRMVYRKLLYTAVTRAKKQFIMLSTASIIEQAIRNNDTEIRFCNLIGRLKEERLRKLFAS